MSEKIPFINGSNLLGGVSAATVTAAARAVPSDFIREAERRVMPYEAEKAKGQVEEEFKVACGVYPPIACGYYIYVRIYQRDPEKKIQTAEGEKTLLIRSHAAVTEDKYQSCVGLVVAIGPQAYKGTNFDGTPRYPDGPWCKVGDIVLIPRYEGVQVSVGDFRNRPADAVPLMIIADDKIMGITPDPEFVVATHVIDRN